MTDRRPIIEIANGKKDFGQFTALHGINLPITQGEIVTLLDPSGSGKTTLMRIIAGFDRLSSETLKIDGKNVAALAPKKHPVNMVFQQYVLFLHLDVFEKVAFGLRVKGVSKEECREWVQRMLRIVQMEHLQ